MMQSRYGCNVKQLNPMCVVSKKFEKCNYMTFSFFFRQKQQLNHLLTSNTPGRGTETETVII